jgi:hypothetical protein
MGGRLENNPSIGWVHPKSTHAHPLAWANKKFTHKPITLSTQPTFDHPTSILGFIFFSLGLGSKELKIIIFGRWAGCK